jgi:hypothetical protein
MPLTLTNRPRKMNHLFDLYATHMFLVRIDIECADSDAMRVLDAVRGEFPGLVDGLFGWTPSDWKPVEDAKRSGSNGEELCRTSEEGTFSAIAMTCEEGESLPHQIQALRYALAGYDIDVRVFDVTEDKNWTHTFYDDAGLPSDDDWSNR